MKKITHPKKIIVTIVLTVIGFVFIIIGLKKPIIFRPEATNNQCGGCRAGESCNLEGQYCEVFIRCNNQTPIIEVYQCLTENNRRQWVFRYSQEGGYCQFSQCGTPLPTPTPGQCNCAGGTFGINFVANRPLTNNESISCQVESSGQCTCGGSPCTGAFRNGSCTISPGSNNCWVSNLDCSCNPFTYTCQGSVSISGQFTGSDVINGGSRQINLTLTEIQPTTIPTSPPQPTAPPTSTPTPLPLATNTPTPSSTPTSTPTPTISPTQTPTPIKTPTSTPTSSQPTPTQTPSPGITASPTPTPSATPTPTLNPTSTPTSTPLPTATPTQVRTQNQPSPTEVILVQEEKSISSVTSPIQRSPTLYQAGRSKLLYILLPLVVIFIGLIL